MPILNVSITSTQHILVPSNLHALGSSASSQVLFFTSAQHGLPVFAQSAPDQGPCMHAGYTDIKDITRTLRTCRPYRWSIALIAKSIAASCLLRHTACMSHQGSGSAYASL